MCLCQDCGSKNCDVYAGSSEVSSGYVSNAHRVYMAQMEGSTMGMLKNSMENYYFSSLLVLVVYHHSKLLNLRFRQLFAIQHVSVKCVICFQWFCCSWWNVSIMWNKQTHWNIGLMTSVLLFMARHCLEHWVGILDLDDPSVTNWNFGRVDSQSISVNNNMWYRVRWPTIVTVTDPLYL